MNVGTMNEAADSLQATKDQLCKLLQILRGPFFAQLIQNLQILVENVSSYCNGNTPNAEFDEYIRTQITRLKSLVSETDSIGSGIIGLILKWRRYQAFIANGTQCPDDLPDIKTLIWQFLEASTYLLCVNVLTAMELGDLQRTRVDVMYNAFIVSEQPTQVIKKSSNFSAEVQWLVGRQVKIGSEHKCPIVTCLILSEAQVREYLANSANYNSHGVLSTPESSANLENNTATLQFDNEKGVYLAKFSNMKWSNITRAPRLGDATVVDEKFALLFVTSVDMDGYRIRLWTLSLPVVAIVHGNQDRNAWATITWDNAFAEMEREAFKVPDKVSWSQFSAVLNTKFASITGRLLTEENLSFIHRKLNRGNFDPKYIKWNQFCKADLPELNFTFWEWFCGITKLIKDHLSDIWKAGLITGFISKQEAEAMLANMPVGTFLMRFSESSHLAGISISCVTRTNEVCHVAPWTAPDFSSVKFADHIGRMEALMFLYPNNAPKDDVFREYYTPQRAHGPYTPRIVIDVVIGATVQQQREGTVPQAVSNWPQQQQERSSQQSGLRPTTDPGALSLAEDCGFPAGQPQLQLQLQQEQPIIYETTNNLHNQQEPLQQSVHRAELGENFHGLQQQTSPISPDTNNMAAPQQQSTFYGGANNFPQQQQATTYEGINYFSLPQQEQQATMYQVNNNNYLQQVDPPICLSKY